ncbi:GNAT family N-acetyltransferase [Dyella solisilvae]|uniref:GNAT family N-acetyltransferase n=1 Tax=Dyella solisilvae TaxID=1920168 RepID=A0A370K6I8_9GAMM|nr:GNAT family N-acetyltransferase [Dyella solisilvae]RDI97630.1 GNAT family N-acetyltransferase [Dyella solisilvae]
MTTPSGEIFLVESAGEVASCFQAFHALRPHLTEAAFLSQVERQRAQGYRIVGWRRDGRVCSAAGFRLAEFLAWGKVLYIDDLTTLPGETGNGYAGALLDWLITHAQEQRCDAVHLDTGYARHIAHRLYLRKGFQLSSHHMALNLADLH